MPSRRRKTPKNLRKTTVSQPPDNAPALPLSHVSETPVAQIQDDAGGLFSYLRRPCGDIFSANRLISWFFHAIWIFVSVWVLYELYEVYRQMIAQLNDDECGTGVVNGTECDCE